MIGVSRRRWSLRVLLGASARTLAFLSWLGLCDVARRGVELSALEALQAGVLWTLLGLPAALGLGAAVAAFVLLGGPDRLRLAAWLKALAWLAGLVLALRHELLGMLELCLATAFVFSRLRSWQRAHASDPWNALLACAVCLACCALARAWPAAPWAPGAGLGLWIGGLLLPRAGTSRRWVTSIGLLALCLPALLAFRIARVDGAAVAGRSSPNVVVVVLDTQRVDYLGAYSSAGAAGDAPSGRGSLTPHFDAFCEESTLFEHAYATAPWTVPSHASLFTGLYPRTHGCSYRHHRWLDEEFDTLAEGLGRAGYQTAGFSANLWLRLANLHQGFEHFVEPGRRFRSLALRATLQVLGFPARWSDHGAQDAVEKVREYLSSTRDPGRPQFLFVNLLEPHWRYLPALGDRLEHLPEGVGLLQATRLSTRMYGPELMAGKELEGPVVEVLRGFYSAAVAYQDRQLGRLLHCLDAHLDRDNTLVVITADHGENLGEGGRFDHVFAVNDHLIKVPLVLRHPGRFEAGRRVAGLCSILDVAATIAGLVPGCRLREPPAGATLLPGRFAPREFIVAEGDPYFGHLERMARYTGQERDIGEFTDFLVAVHDGRYKLVLSTSEPPALYDVSEDPDELDNLWSEGGSTLDRLLGAAREFEDSHAEYEPAVRASVHMTDEQRQLLEQIGYR